MELGAGGSRAEEEAVQGARGRRILGGHSGSTKEEDRRPAWAAYNAGGQGLRGEEEKELGTGGGRGATT